MFGRRWTLPKHEGPFVPGLYDITTEPSSEHDALLVRLYYPTDLPKNQDHSSGFKEWLPHPRYMNGMAFAVEIWSWVVKFLFWLLSGTTVVPAVWAAAPAQRKSPVIILSHGLGGHRAFYASTCIQLASHGFVVACVEHGDRSACITFRRLLREQWIYFERLPKDTSLFAGLRESQIEHRVRDNLSTLHMLEQMQAGSLASSIDMTGCLDFSSLTMMGHSFGGATALATLGKESRFKFGIILDAWMYPLNKDKETLPDAIRQPLIFINTETFHIQKNITAMKRYVKQHPVYTMKRTTHEYQTDSVLLLGSWLNFFMRNKMSGSDGMRINNHLIQRWLHKHVDKQVTFDQAYLDNQAEDIVEDLIVWK